MKKILFGLTLVLAASTSVWAQADRNVPAPQVQENPNGPKFDFKGGNVHDFGEIQESEAGAEYVFEFTNTGKEPLIIQDAQPSCSCTVPEFPKEPILPGKKGKIRVHYKSAGHPGPFIKSVFLTSNAGANKFELIIKGTVAAKPQQHSDHDGHQH